MKQRPKFRINDIQDNTGKYVNNEESTEMSIRQNNQRTIDIAISDGDTLQALSIRYQCPVAELKRLNNLHRENEIFARPTLKVPFWAFSMAAVHKSGDSSPDKSQFKISVDVNILKEKLSSASIDANNKSSLIDNNLTDLKSSNQENSFNEIIFNTCIADKDEDENELSDEEVHLLPKIEVAEPLSAEINCSGADWGLSWPLLLAIILLVAFVGPLIYIFYIAEHPAKFHRQS